MRVLSILKLMQSVLLTSLFVFANTGVYAMDQQEMESTVKQLSQQSRGGQGVVEFTFRDLPMMLISDVTHNRMRIITPIAEYKILGKQQIDEVMESNFHSALDARYAVSDGILYSVYVHTLSDLNQRLLLSAINQVSSLALTFGTDYNSGALSFGAQEAEQPSY